MRRRDFLKLVSSAGIVAPSYAYAQTVSRTYRVGLFNRGAPVTDTSGYGKALIRGLEKRGYVLGRNLEFERRGAGGRFDILPNLLAELVASKVDVIVAIRLPSGVHQPKHEQRCRSSHIQPVIQSAPAWSTTWPGPAAT